MTHTCFIRYKIEERTFTEAVDAAYLRPSEYSGATA